MEPTKKCGCKGIRTCLICEKEGTPSKDTHCIKEADQFEFCPHCCLCWLLGGTGPPLFLGQLTLFLDFVTDDEEIELVSAIDSIQWMPSQSGRRKQDFGPKVNFKRKKSKVGDFKGFPGFTRNLVARLRQCHSLSDFRPVELCHLDYDPDRGSAIEPHIDDSWIWGERLVTLNLASTTFLTLTPADADRECGCQSLLTDLAKENGRDIKSSSDVLDSGALEEVTQGGLSRSDVKKCLDCKSNDLELSAQCIDTMKEHGNYNHTSGKGFSNVKESTSSTFESESIMYNSITKNIEESNDCQTKDLKMFISDKTINTNPSNLSQQNSDKGFDTNKAYTAKDIGDKSPQIPSNFNNHLCNHRTVLTSLQNRQLNPKEPFTVEDACSAYRTRKKKVEILIPLPPRSLLVLAGCSRHNWFHEIKRKDIGSRRVAMTFRELAGDFMPGGPEELVGGQLLELGQTFYEMNV